MCYFIRFSLMQCPWSVMGKTWFANPADKLTWLKFTHEQTVLNAFYASCRLACHWFMMTKRAYETFPINLLNFFIIYVCTFCYFIVAVVFSAIDLGFTVYYSRIFIINSRIGFNLLWWNMCFFQRLKFYLWRHTSVTDGIAAVRTSQVKNQPLVNFCKFCLSIYVFNLMVVNRIIENSFSLIFILYFGIEPKWRMVNNTEAWNM